MRITKIFKLDDVELFKHKLIEWGQKFDNILVLDSHNIASTNSSKQEYNTYDFLVAIDSLKEISPLENSFGALKKAVDDTKDWWFGFLSYDLKNELEDLESRNQDRVLMPKMHFFQPRWIFKIENDSLEISFLCADSEYVNDIFTEIVNQKIFNNKQYVEGLVKSRISKQEYLNTVNEIKAQIAKGNIYELNFCQEFYMENVKLNPLSMYNKLQELSPTPYSCFCKLNDKYLMCSSPERFLKKQADVLISQPIKGTAKRGNTKSEDESIKKNLFKDPKERAENIMIVDLVRNDLARTSEGGSVVVEELCGIYTFPQVHQMISTIVSKKDKNVHLVDCIKKCFPMGSMTGAPKLRSMQIIEELESTKRGLYSGAVGYIDPNGDFDFNVVIRSLQYNEREKYLSFMVGGAITMKSIAQQEYEECMLKAAAIRKALGV